jgi:type II secretion system (T2SS) protein M
MKRLGMPMGPGNRFDLRENLWRIAAVLGVLLLLNLGFYLLFNLPRLRSLKTLEDSRNSAARDLRGTQGRCDKMREYLSGYDDTTRRLDDFYGNFLGTQVERMTTIQKEVRSIATEFHIDPESIDYNSQELEGAGMTLFQVTIPLVGGYPNLRQFINRIESSKHLLIVDSVELTGAREGGAMLSLTIKISTVFHSPQQTVAPPRAPA